MPMQLRLLYELKSLLGVAGLLEAVRVALFPVSPPGPGYSNPGDTGSKI